MNYYYHSKTKYINVSEENLAKASASVIQENFNLNYSSNKSTLCKLTYSNMHK